MTDILFYPQRQIMSFFRGSRKRPYQIPEIIEGLRTWQNLKEQTTQIESEMEEKREVLSYDKLKYAINNHKFVF